MADIERMRKSMTGRRDGDGGSKRERMSEGTGRGRKGGREVGRERATL